MFPISRSRGGGRPERNAWRRLLGDYRFGLLRRVPELPRAARRGSPVLPGAPQARDLLLDRVAGLGDGEFRQAGRGRPEEILPGMGTKNTLPKPPDGSGHKVGSIGTKSAGVAARIDVNASVILDTKQNWKLLISAVLHMADYSMNRNMQRELPVTVKTVITAIAIMQVKVRNIVVVLFNSEFNSAVFTERQVAHPRFILFVG